MKKQAASADPILAPAVKPKRKYKRKAVPAPAAKPLSLHWRWHSSGMRVRRVWRSDWAHDTFEMVEGSEAFDLIVCTMAQFGIPVLEVEDGDEG